ncbi:hypothetical protein SANTM175S_00864 [Streptomyces antimycoticus]
MRRALGLCRPTRRVLDGSVGVRLLEPPHMAERPCDHHGAADHHVVRDRALIRLVEMDAGVRRIGPMIPHDEHPPLRDGHLELPLRRRVPGVQIRLVQRGPVDGDLTVRIAARHGVAAHRDHPLDQVLLVAGRQQADEGQELLALLDDRRVVLGGLALVIQPAPGVLEHHHIATLRLRAEPRVNLSTSTRSPIRMVCSIEPDGMTNACTRKVFRTSAITSATPTRIGISLTAERRRLRLIRRWILRRSARPPTRRSPGARVVSTPAGGPTVRRALARGRPRLPMGTTGGIGGYGAGRRGHAREGVRTGHTGPAAERPADPCGAADHLVDGDRAPARCAQVVA